MPRKSLSSHVQLITAPSVRALASVTLAVALAGTRPAVAQQGAPTDSTAGGTNARVAGGSEPRYSLTRRVPRELMRDLSTDRPDRTESPYTVDVGHVQLEMDLVNLTDDRTGEWRSRSYGVGALNAKLGLSRNIDLQVVTEFLSFTQERDPTLGSSSHHSAFSDVSARLKINLWGNDGGTTAFGVMPFVTVPTRDRETRAVEGGIIFPLAIALRGGWGMGLMSELDVVRRANTPGYHINILHSATVNHEVYGPIAAYGELVAEIVTEGRPILVPTADAGLTFGATSNLQFDIGANIGLNRNAPRINAFVGISRRY